MSVVVRYIFGGSICEQFVGMTEVQSLYAQGLTDEIVKQIRRLSSLSGNGVSLHNCVGQGYDGASVVAGHLSGVNVLIRETYAWHHIFTVSTIDSIWYWLTSLSRCRVVVKH